MALGTYSFLPWLRQGLANQITSGDNDETVRVRAQVNVGLELRGRQVSDGELSPPVPVNRPVALFGPGDIVGIDRRAIFRVEPRNWITNFEPNYLAHIEFYDEDFPWRYTPAAPDLDLGRLRPWITLVVLAEGEFTDGRNMKDKPVPFIDVPDPSVLPLADELWAWAHVHVNRSLAANDAEFVSDDMAAVIPKLEDVLNKNPDLAYSRIVCPRRLAENTPYHAFLIPTFEAGRRAGLGLEIGDIPATMSSWDPGPRPDPQSYPFYHRWFFRTGATGDFEALVRLLVPKPVDRRVGTREMDVQNPGSNVRGLDKPELGGILKLGGALRPPSNVPPDPPDIFERWDETFPRPLQEDLARLINLADDYQTLGDPDPIITPPLYGTWHALRKRVLRDRDGNLINPPNNWVQRLNLDPRFRAAAGFGTRVIQDNQEKYMDAAWEQIGKVLEAQRRIRLGHFSVMISDIWFDRHLMPMLGVSHQKTLLMMAPLNKRVLTSGAVTVHHTLTTAFVQPAMTSPALRRIIRPRGRLIRKLPFDDTTTLDQLIDRVNDGEVSAAPPKVAPPGVVTTDEAAAAVIPQDAPAWVIDLLRRFPRLALFVLIAALLLALIFVLLAFVFSLFPLFLVLAIVAIAVGFYLYRLLLRWSNALRASDLLSDAGQTPEAIDRLPPSSNFTITEPGSGFVPTLGGTDSVEAGRFKEALRNIFSLVQASAQVGAPIVKQRLDLVSFTANAVETVRPSRTIPVRVMAGVFVPPRLVNEMVIPPEVFVEPMAYPVIDQPMYEPLTKRSSELFLPNINLIEFNSITLLETNQRFIESYMVGLNHEFARELLWREYPTDQRGSTFRQFWDVRGFFNAENLNDETLKERLRDIPPLHRWSLNSELGTHDNRELSGEVEEELVLVIRGELLKRYPNAVIYAHRACWQRKEVTAADKDLDPCLKSGGIDNTKERRLAPLTAAEEATPPRSKVLTPLYEAVVDPDIHFFGFDLTVAEAKGGTGENPTDDPGWFFVIKERPGEPRFGLDDSRTSPLSVWNDLSWPDVQPDGPADFLVIADSPDGFTLTAPGPSDEEKAPQRVEDLEVDWSHEMSSAQLAYILWQAPVLVAVHASEMLPK
jgi:hypothetical protein